MKQGLESKAGLLQDSRTKSETVAETDLNKVAKAEVLHFRELSISKFRINQSKFTIKDQRKHHCEWKSTNNEGGFRPQELEIRDQKHRVFSRVHEICKYTTITKNKQQVDFLHDQEDM